MTRHTKCAADGPKHLLAGFSRSGTELFEPFTDTPSMVPFFFLYLFDACPLGRIF